MASLNTHGLEPQEEAIMDLWDAGLAEETIAARLGLSASRVKSVAASIGENEADRWHLRAKAATAQLGLALAKAMAA